ncbi:MAG: hypothetical protein H0W70_04345 [Actinobacteria bacterium]|nr:hypothetical protein [Actinomycetota bacterium]
MKRSVLVAATFLALGVAGACRGPSKSSSGTSSTAPSSTTSTAAADHSNAPEVSPAGDIPDNQVFVEYSPPTGGYSVKVPEGWARMESGRAVTFTDKLNSIRMETKSAAAAPTVSSARQDEVPAIEGASKNYRAGKVTQVTRKSGPAILITYRADSEPDAVTGKVVHDDVERYEFWRSGNEIILTLSGPVGADNVDPWRVVTDSLTWK